MKNAKTNAAPKILNGIPSSPGMFMGKAIVLKAETVIVPDEKISADKIPAEIERFNNAIDEVIREYEQTVSLLEKSHSSVTSIIETSLQLIKDDFLLQEIRKLIALGFTVESSITQYLDTQKQFFLSAKDSIIRDRAIDIENLKDRLLSTLRHKNIYYKIGKGTIVVAKSVTPTELVHFKEAGVGGIITEVGGITAHFSIMARSFEIPTLIGISNATSKVKNGSEVIINGYSGWAMLNPDSKAIGSYQLKKAIEEEHRARLSELRTLKSETQDGHKILVLSNINSDQDIETAAKVKADGVGLVRTESLIISLNKIPSEKVQFDWYLQMANIAYPDPITFRAFDIGSDKFSEGIPFHEANPALGLRGIRFLLHRKDIFKSQIRAILRSSGNKNVRFMLPMIISLSEVFETKKLIEECKAELRESGSVFDENMPLGIMVETPSAALMSENFAKHVDFFSIGSNDLTQYALAADRTNDLVLENFDSFHPAVLKLIKLTATAAQNAGIKVCVCGEIAGHIAATELLIGLGINELSISPSIHLETKKRIRQTNYAAAGKLAEQVLHCDSPAEVMELLS
ncbi:MAG: phosphoenolpyruvate--protein phosphotransferase [Candidatus Kapabacteria bacterium]|nr:phosphoenolpyruvate--protein phosphotransferase [Candidatus Kapabacteria bacterium]